MGEIGDFAGDYARKIPNFAFLSSFPRRCE